MASCRAQDGAANRENGRAEATWRRLSAGIMAASGRPPSLMLADAARCRRSIVRECVGRLSETLLRTTRVWCAWLVVFSTFARPRRIPNWLALLSSSNATYVRTLLCVWCVVDHWLALQRRLASDYQVQYLKFAGQSVLKVEVQSADSVCVQEWH